MPHLRSSPTESAGVGRKRSHNSSVHDESPCRKRRRPSETPSWEDKFFEETDGIPGLRKIWIPDLEQVHLRFEYKTLRFIRPLTAVPPDAPAEVWVVQADSKRYAMKMFSPYTNEMASSQAERLPQARLRPEKVRHDASPFLLELRAQEQIRRFCPNSKRHFFPHYHGAVRIPRSLYPLGHLHRRDGIVLDILNTEAENRHLASTNIPPTLMNDVDAFEEDLDTLNLPVLEKKWYKSLLKGRLERVTTLHALGISHGDIENSCFGLANYVHDIALYDFSLSYTFTPEWPCMMNGTRKLRTLRRAAEIDRDNVRLGTVKLAKRRQFLSHIATLLRTTDKEADDILRAISSSDQPETGLSMILLSVVIDENRPFFPSISSILPFLEPAASSQSPTWMISVAEHLDNYVALSWSEADRYVEERKGPSLVSSASTVLQQVDMAYGLEFQKGSVSRRPSVVLFPRAWLNCLDLERLCHTVFSPTFIGTSIVNVLSREEADLMMGVVSGQEI